MLAKQLKYIPLAAALAFGLAAPAHADSTGWINANDFQDFSRHLLKHGFLPVSISCKNKDAVPGMDRRNTIIKVEYVPNTKRIAWKWAWGSEIGYRSRDYGKQGFKLVSEDSFRRDTGLVMKCAIWQKQ